MPSDPSIYNPLAQPLRSPLEYAGQFSQTVNAANQNKLQAVALQQAQEAEQERNALRAYLSSAPDLTSAEGIARGYSAAPTQFGGIAKTFQDRLTAQAQANKDNAQAGKATAETDQAKQATAIQAHQQHLQALSMVQTPQDAVQWMLDGVRTGALPEAGLQQGLAKLQQAATDPQAFAQWKQGVAQAGMTVQQQMEMTAPKPTEIRLGNVVKVLDLNPRSPTYGKEVTPAQQVGISPDTAYSQSQENSRAAAARGVQLQIAGMSPDGAPSQNVEQMAQAIARGAAAPITGFALAKPQGQTVMRRVFEINPQYDETTYGAKVAAAKGFASGQQGNALRSVATANAHLDQMGELVDALNNGNIQLVNKIGNAYQQQTGNPAPTNFDAVKNVIGQEVVKAIVAGGGSAGERDEAAKAFSNASSPAQLKGAIQHYRMIMGAQQTNLLEQRRAAGLPDSTLPNYSGSQSSVPPDIQAILDKHGAK